MHGTWPVVIAWLVDCVITGGHDGVGVGGVIGCQAGAIGTVSGCGLSGAALKLDANTIAETQISARGIVI